MAAQTPRFNIGDWVNISAIFMIHRQDTPGKIVKRVAENADLDVPILCQVVGVARRKTGTFWKEYESGEFGSYLSSWTVFKPEKTYTVWQVRCGLSSKIIEVLDENIAPYTGKKKPKMMWRGVKV